MMRLLLVGDVFGSCGTGIAFELCANDGGKDGQELRFVVEGEFLVDAAVQVDGECGNAQDTRRRA